MKNLLTIVFTLLFIVIFIALTFLFMQFFNLKQGYWGKMCSWDKVDKGKIKELSAIVFVDEKFKCPDNGKEIRFWIKK